jgi:transposase
MATNPENPIRNYSHTSVPDHVADLRKQAENPQEPRESNGEKALPLQAVIYVNRHAKRFLEALGNPNDPFRPAAERAMRGFARAVEKPPVDKTEGISLNSAAREFNVPRSFLWRWTKQYRVIPMLSEGKGIGSPTYLDRGKAQEVAEIYHEAKRQHKQPKKLLEEKYPESSKPSQKWTS